VSNRRYKAYKIMNKIFILLIFFIYGCSNNLEKYYFDYSEFAQEFPANLIDTSSVFTIKINRDIRFKTWKKLIEKAESCFPPVEEVLKHYKYKDNIKDFDKNLWWYKKSDGVNIPYAITYSSVNYYINLINNFKKGKFKESGTAEMKFARFTYSAKVHSYSSIVYNESKYENIYVVELKLRWKNNCGPLCATSFDKNRLVIFREDDFKLLGIIGDGKTNYVVS